MNNRRSLRVLTAVLFAFVILSAARPLEAQSPTIASDKPAATNPNLDKSNTGNSTSIHTATAKAATLPTAPVPQGAVTDKWQFQFSPYLWMAGLHGTAGIGTRSTEVDERFSDLLDVLDFAFMGTFEARKGRLISLTDLQYVAVSDEKATPGPLFSSVKAKFKTFIFDPEVGYRVFDHTEKGDFLDVVGGARIWHVNSELDFSAGVLPATTAQGSRTWVDGVVGLRGRAALSPKVFVTGKADLGGGGSKFTYQLFGGGGYNFNQRIALILGYRVLDVNHNKNNFLYDMSQRGPIVGVGFKF